MNTPTTPHRRSEGHRPTAAALPKSAPLAAIVPLPSLAQAALAHARELCTFALLVGIVTLFALPSLAAAADQRHGHRVGGSEKRATIASTRPTEANIGCPPSAADNWVDNCRF